MVLEPLSIVRIHVLQYTKHYRLLTSSVPHLDGPSWMQDGAKMADLAPRWGQDGELEVQDGQLDALWGGFLATLLRSWARPLKK